MVGLKGGGGGGDTEQKVLGIFKAVGADITPADVSIVHRTGEEEEEEADPWALCVQEEEEGGHAEEGIERQTGVSGSVRV